MVDLVYDDDSLSFSLAAASTLYCVDVMVNPTNWPVETCTQPSFYSIMPSALCGCPNQESFIRPLLHAHDKGTLNGKLFAAEMEFIFIDQNVRRGLFYFKDMEQC